MNLWIAQGFGVGRTPVAPGTFGSVVGLGWFALLVAPGSLWGLIGGSLGGLVVSVIVCGSAERQLGQKDPGSVVFDEIAAVPLCYFAWLALGFERQNGLPGLGDIVNRWPFVVGILAAFRVFDVLKPWPVGRSQALPGGWGITVDDVLAAAYVNLVVMLAGAFGAFH